MEKLQGLAKKKEKEPAISAADDVFAAEEEDKTDPGVSAAAEVSDSSAEDATVFEAPEDAGDIGDMMFEVDEGVPSPDATQDAPTVDAIQEAAAEGPDPLEEVDVYEAFGDYEQAAEIVKQAIVDQPGNNGFKLRLFKVFQAGGLKDEFSQAAVDHKDAMADSPEWGEVEEMGKAFAPDSPAWSGGGAVAPAESVAQPAADAGEDMSATMAMDVAAAAEVTEDTGESLDFGDLDFELGDASDDAPAATVDDATQAVDQVMEADAGAMEAESTQALDDSANVAVAAGGDSNSLEFDLNDMDFEDASVNEEALESPEAELDLGGMDFEEPSATEEALEPLESESADAGNSLEFDLGDFGAELQADEPAAEDKVSEPAGNELEFDMGDMDLGSSEEPAAETVDSTPGDEISLDDDMSMDFELDDLSSAEAPLENLDVTASPDTVQLDVSADELESASQAAETPDSEDPTVMFADVQSTETVEEPSVDADESMGVDLSDFSFDLDESTSEEALDTDALLSEDLTATLDESDDSLGQSLSAEGDEVATKLDLARAYIDMGDSDGAKGILDEVIAEGSDAQKAEAEELLQTA